MLTRRTCVGALLGLPAALLAPPRAARAATHRFLLIGSSTMGGGFGLYLEQALEREHGQQVHRFAKPSTSLSRPDFFDWPRKAAELVETFRPDVSLAMFGANDVQGLHMGKGADWIRWHDEGWSAEYARRVAALAQVLAPSGQHLFWVGMPVMRSDKINSRVQRLNTIFRAEMAIRRNSRFVDTWRVMADANGKYADKVPVRENGRPVLVRAGDGVHMTVAGAHLLKAHVLSEIVETLALA